LRKFAPTSDHNDRAKEVAKEIVGGVPGYDIRPREVGILSETRTFGQTKLDGAEIADQEE